MKRCALRKSAAGRGAVLGTARCTLDSGQYEVRLGLGQAAWELTYAPTQNGETASEGAES
jgi:hypothetical protein